MIGVRLLYLVEWRENDAWTYRAFTSEAPALRVAARVARRCTAGPIIAAVLPGDVRMINAGAAVT